MHTLTNTAINLRAKRICKQFLRFKIIHILPYENVNSHTMYCACFGNLMSS